MRKIILGLIVLCFSYFANGQERVLFDSLKIDNDIAYYKSNLFTGIAFSKYDNGQLEREANYKDGKYDGVYKRWYDNGQLDLEYNYKDGKKDGDIISEKCWDEEGNEIDCPD